MRHPIMTCIYFIDYIKWLRPNMFNFKNHLCLKQSRKMLFITLILHWNCWINSFGRQEWYYVCLLKIKLPNRVSLDIIAMGSHTDLRTWYINIIANEWYNSINENMYQPCQWTAVSSWVNIFPRFPSRQLIIPEIYSTKSHMKLRPFSIYLFSINMKMFNYLQEWFILCLLTTYCVSYLTHCYSSF